MSDSTNADRPVMGSAGHLSVRLDYLHPREQMFSFETRGQRTWGSMGVSVAFHTVAVVTVAFLSIWLPTLGDPIDLRDAVDNARTDHVVWLAEPGPGGGGGGGGNKSIEPPRPAELPGKDKITVPVMKPPDVMPKPDPPKDVVPEQVFNIPAQLMASAENTLVGAMDGMQTSNSPTAQGSGSGGGAGTGTGTGIGPGSGSGLGPGWGGGTGGGRVSTRRRDRDAAPAARSEAELHGDAMRAKVQGMVVLDCVVGVDGSVGECDVVRSLDSSFGLDQEAVKAAKQWRFVPGKRQGQPVPVLVTIELTFNLR